MVYAIYPFTLELTKTLSQISIPVTLRDTKRRFLISLTNGGKPYILTDGCMAIFTATKDDGAVLYNECAILDHTVIRYDFTEQTTSADGMMDCQLKIYGENGEIIASPKFTMIVYKPSVDIDNTASEDEKTALENIVSREYARMIAEEQRKTDFENMMEIFGNLGGIAVQNEEPNNPRIAAWVDADAEDEYVEILTPDDYSEIADDLTAPVAERVAEKEGLVPYTRTVNGKPLSEDVNLTPEDVESVGMVLLWENAAPDDAFPAQTIALDLSEYRCVFITANGEDYSAVAEGRSYPKIPHSGCGFFMKGYHKNSLLGLVDYYLVNRSVYVKADGTGIEFGSGNQQRLWSASTTSDNKHDSDLYLIPQKIYGVRGI